MPHDISGKLIERGDIIKVRPLNYFRDIMGDQAGENLKVVGVVRNITPGAEMCSGHVVFQVIGGTHSDYFNAKAAELILKHDGSEPA